MKKAFCPECEDLTWCVLLDKWVYPDGCYCETYQCRECNTTFERIFPAPGYYWMICDGCAALSQIKLANPEDKAVVTVTCKCGKVSTYDTAEMMPTGGMPR